MCCAAFGAVRGCCAYPLAILAIILSAVIIGMTAHDMTGVTDITKVNLDTFKNGTGTCLLSGDGTSDSVCNVAYGVGSLSLVLAVLIAILNMIMACCNSSCTIVNTYIAIVMALLLAAVAIFFTYEANLADNNGIPKENERHTVVVFSYFLLIVWGCYCIVGGCCRPCGQSKKKSSTYSKV